MLTVSIEIYINKNHTGPTMLAVKGSTSKRPWLVHNASLTLMKNLHVNTTFIYLTYQLFQVNQRPSPLLPQVVVCCSALNFKTTTFYYYSTYLLFQRIKHSGLLFEGEGGPFEAAELELSDDIKLIYIHLANSQYIYSAA